MEIAAFLRSCDGVPPCRLPSTGARRTGDVAAGIGTQASSRGFSLLICKRCRAPRHAGRPCAPEPLCQVGPTSCIRANPNQRACRALILVHGGMPSPGSRGAHGGKTGLPKGLNGSSTCRGFESGVRGHHRRRRRSHSDRVCVASCRIYVTRPKHVCGAKRAHLRSRCASGRPTTVVCRRDGRCVLLGEVPCHMARVPNQSPATGQFATHRCSPWRMLGFAQPL